MQRGSGGACSRNYGDVDCRSLSCVVNAKKNKQHRSTNSAVQSHGCVQVGSSLPDRGLREGESEACSSIRGKKKKKKTNRYVLGIFIGSLFCFGGWLVEFSSQFSTSVTSPTPASPTHHEALAGIPLILGWDEPKRLCRW